MRSVLQSMNPCDRSAANGRRQWSSGSNAGAKEEAAVGRKEGGICAIGGTSNGLLAQSNCIALWMLCPAPVYHAELRASLR